jgi:hypothetical protein
MSPDLGATLSRGAEFAAGAGATDVTLEHLLAALCDDRDAIAVLDASNVDIAALKADVAGQFPQGEPAADAPVSLGVSQDVRRILEAAAAAARGSRRRDINGAIVLAAIVGDGRSMAAQTLQTHGLTFDGAIRALQTALMPQQRAPAPQAPPVADDVLARARERVQSRSTPSLRDLMNDQPRPATQPDVTQSDERIDYSSRSDASAEDDGAHRSSSGTPQQYPQPSGAPASQHGEPEPSAQPALERDARSSAPGPEHDSAGDPGLPPFSETQPANRPGPPRQAAPSQPAMPPSREMPVGPPGPSLPFPGRPAAAPIQPSPGSPPQGAPAGPRGAFPMSSDGGPVPGAPPGRAFPGDLPRPRPVGGQPPPIPVPGSPMPPGMRSGAPGAMPGSASLGAGPGPLQAEPSLRPDMRMDQKVPGAPGPQQQRPQPAKGKGTARKKGKGAKVDQGQLAENIPRSMRVGRTERVEVRIAKASVKALTEGLEGDGAVWQHQVTITKAMAVRIRAPEGGFFIETASPETQWIENNLGYSNDDFASWRFLITPQWRGWSQLQIIISARTIGADGVAAETALPDQIIEVKVRRNLKRTFARLFGWAVAAIAGGALATFGATGMTSVKALLDSFIR